MNETQEVWPGESPTRKKVKALWPEHTAREIAERLGLTTQAIYIHINAIKREQKR